MERRNDNIGHRTFFTRKTRHQRHLAGAGVVRAAKKASNRHYRRAAKNMLRRADW